MSLFWLVLEVLRISSLSLLHSEQLVVPNDFTALIGLPCQMIEHSIEFLWRVGKREEKFISCSAKCLA